MNNANLIGLNYQQEANKFHKFEIIDIHSHINGIQATYKLKEVMRLYGICKIFSMTNSLDEVPKIKEILTDQVEFIVIPKIRSDNPKYEANQGFLKRIDEFQKYNAKLVKFWAAPRGLDISGGNENYFALHQPSIHQVIKHAKNYNMNFMVHVADPDTWFQTKYSDHKKYGYKKDHYKPFQELLAKYSDSFWIAAHMAGYPEDLEFLDDLLTTHTNLYLDTSATKWMVRELSKHSSDDLLEFFNKWQDRLLFGSDIVTSNEHLNDQSTPALDLYASRYWALRTLFETDYQGISPIVDPDLEMISPDKYNSNSSAILKGQAISNKILEKIYYKNSVNLFTRNS
jgi:predicted TIM-barrel fold metal-dependent hydrolase